MRLDRAGVELGDVEDRAERFVERFDRSHHVVDERLVDRSGHAPLERRAEEAQRMQRLAQVVAGRGEELALVPARLRRQLHLLVQALDQGGVLALGPQGAAELVVLRERQAQEDGHPGHGDKRQDEVGLAAVPEQHQRQRRRDGHQPQVDRRAIGRHCDRADDGRAEQDQDEQGGVREIVRREQEDRCDPPADRRQRQDDPMALSPRRRTVSAAASRRNASSTPSIATWEL